MFGCIKARSARCFSWRRESWFPAMKRIGFLEEASCRRVSVLMARFQRNSRISGGTESKTSLALSIRPSGQSSPKRKVFRNSFVNGGLKGSLRTTLSHQVVWEAGLLKNDEQRIIDSRSWG